MNLGRCPPCLRSGRHQNLWTKYKPPGSYWCGVGRQNGLRQNERQLYRTKDRYPGKGLVTSWLSINLVLPTLAAITARVPGFWKVAGSTSSAYSRWTSGSSVRRAAIRARRRTGSRSPDEYAAAASRRAALMLLADLRSSGPRYTFRELSASPSGSRTVGTTLISTPRSRSRASRLTTATCCASFWPKYARSGATAASSLVTTVATPSKCRGRAAPSRPSVTPRTWTRVLAPGGYISAAVGR